MSDFPEKARPLIEQMLESGWSFVVNHGTDTGGCAFVSIEGKRGNSGVKCAWHTRDTGTYRLFTCIASTPGTRWGDVTLRRALSIVGHQP